MVESNLKFVIWYSSRHFSRSLMPAYISFSSTVTVPMPSGLQSIGVKSRVDRGISDQLVQHK